MPDIKTAMSGVLEAEREKNNLALTPYKAGGRGHAAPPEVRKAKVEYVQRRVKEGLTFAKAYAEVSISHSTYTRWTGKAGQWRKAKPMKKAAAPAAPRQRREHARRSYTQAQRETAVSQAWEMIRSGHTALEAAQRTGVEYTSLCAWARRAGKSFRQSRAVQASPDSWQSAKLSVKEVIEIFGGGAATENRILRHMLGNRVAQRRADVSR